MQRRTSLTLASLELALAPSTVFAAQALRQAQADVVAPLVAPQEKGERDVKHFNLDKSKLAIEGYDPVAYFPEGGGKPLKGSDKITVTHKGVVYRFATEENKALFLKTPDKFEPQYGGWCAYAMAQGEKVEIDPKSFKITDGKLFLFYKSFFNDTREKWVKEEAPLTKKADAGWKTILEKPAPKQFELESVR
ncbi:MAG: YHS domain protein [Planctomycetes bacterium]|nr:YHS domain protein [Planctomycetota bacterium]